MPLTAYVWRATPEDAWIEIPESGGLVVGERTVSAAWVAGLDLDERAAMGFAAIDVPERPADPALIVTGHVIEDVGGLPVWTWMTEQRDPEELKVTLRAYARLARWRAEEGGLVFDGHPLPTSAEGKFYIAGAHAKALKDPAHEKRWQVGNDPIAFVTFSNAQLLALGDALDALIQSTFDVLDETVGPRIEAGVITTGAEIDAAFATLNRTFTTPA